MEAKPAFLYSGQDDMLFFNELFDIENLAMRHIKFEIDGPKLCGYLEALQSDNMCLSSNWLAWRDYAKDMLLRRMVSMCQRKWNSAAVRGPRYILEIPPLWTLLSFPPELFSLCTFDKRKAEFVLTACKVKQLDVLFGEGWDILVVEATKTGTEMLKFMFTPPVSFTFPFKGFEVVVKSEGWKKYNGSRVLQWDTSDRAKRSVRRNIHQSSTSVKHPLCMGETSTPVATVEHLEKDSGTSNVSETLQH
eukprot:TRINITY_DN888_c0_g4_i1.p1 TRINITY_DN888_c0_g4~~TRINITY_DN888_c0_g4_i1.p1  ORF type:complete len:248 (+),score=56.79 TRINITY_DN888_c0_g4_i1:609-1352(+)